MKFLSLALFALMLPAAAPAQTQSALIRGIVVDRREGHPLPNTTVELQPENATQPVRRTTTDDDGKFVFAKTAIGSYRVQARRSGFVPSQYGQRGTNDPGSVLTINAADATTGAKDIRIVMVATGSISGQITGDNGLPAGSVRVQALKATFPGDGNRYLTSVQEVLTDDLGQYRLFWISPGTYYVSATIPDGPIDTHILLNPDGVDARGLYDARTQLRSVATTSTRNSAPGNKAHVPVYYPGTASGNLARAIIVDSAADIHSININAASVNTYRVAGVFASSERPAGANVTIRMLPVIPLLSGITTPAPQYQTAADARTGAFEFPKIVPGIFVLTATVAGPNGPRGQTAIEVIDRDIENISLSTTPGVPVQVRFRVEGQPADFDMTKLRASFRPDPFVVGLPSPAANAAADGSATFQGVLPGDYRLYVTPLLIPPGTPNQTVPAAIPNLYLKSAMRGSEDVLNNGLSLKEQDRDVVEIVLGSNPARITGHVARTSNNGPEPADYTTVVLIPDQGRQFRIDTFKTAVTDASGKFQILGIPPGNYRLFAWDDVSPNAWMDPDFLRNYEDRGSSVVLTEGSTVDIGLSAIR